MPGFLIDAFLCFIDLLPPMLGKLVLLIDLVLLVLPLLLVMLMVVIIDMELEPHTYKGKLGLVQPLAQRALLLAMAIDL